MKKIDEMADPNILVKEEDYRAAISLGASVLARIKDPVMREKAIRNALAAATLSCVPSGALPVSENEQAKIDEYKSGSD